MKYKHEEEDKILEDLDKRRKKENKKVEEEKEEKDRLDDEISKGFKKLRE